MAQHKDSIEMSLAEVRAMYEICFGTELHESQPFVVAAKQVYAALGDEEFRARLARLRVGKFTLLS